MPIIGGIISIVMILAGCTPQTVIVTKLVPVMPDDSMIKTCDVTPPPSSDEYFSLNQEFRDRAMFNLAKSQYLDMSKCNNRLLNLQKWKQKQLETFKDPKS